MISERGPDLHCPAQGGIDMIQGDVPFQPQVGSLVSVQSRTWAGINKPGGVGRVCKVYYDSDIPTHVDVKYIVNSGRENHVEIIFVEAYTLDDSQKQRGRSDLTTTTNATTSPRDAPDAASSTVERTRVNSRRTHISGLEIEESFNYKSSDAQKQNDKDEQKKKVLNDNRSLKKRSTLVETCQIPTQSPTKRKNNDHKNNLPDKERIPSTQKQDHVFINDDPPILAAHFMNTEQNNNSIQHEPINIYDRIHTFTILLNKIRIEASLDAINISDLLIRINNHTTFSGGMDEYSNEEVQFYLKILERENKLMIIWEDDMIYWI